MDAFLAKHKVLLWFGILIIAVSLIINNLWGETACGRYDEHNFYWATHGGKDLDPLKGLYLRTQCDLENPCLQLKNHDAYWAGRTDLDPARRILLNTACHGAKQAAEEAAESLKKAAAAAAEEAKRIAELAEKKAKEAIDMVVVKGSDAYRTLKKMSTDAAHALSLPVREKIKSDFYGREQDPHRYEVAKVRVGEHPVSPEERAHRNARFARVKQAQEKFLGMTLADSEVLDISFSLSGGGVRASLCAIGSLLGAQKIGLLDGVMTITALSGGTWALFPWIASGKNIQTYRNEYLATWDKGYANPTAWETQLMLNDAVIMPFAFEKDVTLTDIYNAMLSHMLLSNFGNYRQRVMLSSLANKPQYPVPVGEAVWGDLAGDYWDEEIFEWSPYELYSRWLKAGIPAWGVGRKYNNGVSSNSAPENSLPLGIFGSAYAVSATFIGVKIGAIAPDYMKIPLEKITNTRIGELRGATGIIHNYTYGMPTSPIKDQGDIPLADSGAGKLLQVMPLVGAYRSDAVGHKPDVLFLFDCGTNRSKDLQKLELFAQKLNLPLPRVTGAGVGVPYHDILTIFKDTTPQGTLDLSKPVVMYMPRVSNVALLAEYTKKFGSGAYENILKNFDMDVCLSSGQCRTFTFTWPRERAEQVATQTEFNIVAAAEPIKEALRAVVMAKRKQNQPS